MGVADGDANGGGCDGREVGSTSKVGGVGRLRTHSKPERKEWIADNETVGLSRGSFVKATVGSAAAVLALSLVRRRFGQLLGTEGFILFFLYLIQSDVAPTLSCALLCCKRPTCKSVLPDAVRPYCVRFSLICRQLVLIAETSSDGFLSASRKPVRAIFFAFQ